VEREDEGEREGLEGRVEKWPKHCMHIWIKDKKKLKKKRNSIASEGSHIVLVK
jgi:hypothetical protein